VTQARADAVRIIAELISLPLIDHPAVWLVLSSADGLHGLDAS
jgi:hypothetical protein